MVLSRLPAFVCDRRHHRDAPIERVPDRIGNLPIDRSAIAHVHPAAKARIGHFPRSSTATVWSIAQLPGNECKHAFPNLRVHFLESRIWLALDRQERRWEETGRHKRQSRAAEPSNPDTHQQPGAHSSISARQKYVQPLTTSRQLRGLPGSQLSASSTPVSQAVVRLLPEMWKSGALPTRQSWTDDMLAMALRPGLTDFEARQPRHSCGSIPGSACCPCGA